MNENFCVYCMEPIGEGSGECPHCHAPGSYEAPSHHLRPGTVLRGRYLIGRALGEGGFGITYIGRDTTLDMRIAVKEYYPNGFSNRNHNYTNEVTLTQSTKGQDFERDMQRFLHEARMLAKFSDEPGIVGVRDFFRENGTAYIVMEYLDGITMKAYLKQHGPIPADKLFGMMDPVLQSLDLIHKQGLIHRDISPDNIMVLKNGKLKLLDFGAAREVAEDKSLSVVLKHGYAPEEQYRTKGKQGPWTDVYAMCATMYKCLTGVTPMEALERVMNDELQLPSKLGAVISPRQEQVLMLGLNVRIADRMQGMDALRRGLQMASSEGLRNISVQTQPEEEGKTVYQPVPEKKAEEDHTVYRKPEGGQAKAVVERPEVSVKKATHKPHTEERAVQEAVHKTVKSEKPEKETMKAGKKWPLLVAALLIVAVIAVVVVMGLGGGSESTDIWNSVPTERAMTSDCKALLKEAGVGGSVTDLEIEDATTNEKYQMYIVECVVTVVENGAEQTYSLTLRYEYENNSWQLSDFSKVN